MAMCYSKLNELDKALYFVDKNNKGETPLDFAVKSYKAKVIELLKKYGAKQGKDLK